MTSLKLKKTLYLSHRWLGIAVCLFMALWFVSGVVMLYIGYPKLTSQEHFKPLPILKTLNCCFDFKQVLDSTIQTSSPDNIRLTSISGKPIYIFNFGKRQISVDGRTGELVHEITPRDALASAQSFLKDVDGQYLAIVNEDAWTHSRALDPHRPLHLVEMNDEEKTWLYISSQTGEVVRDANQTERVWNWIGAWLHWLYPFRGGIFDKVAPDIVIYSSLAGTVLTITGLFVGLLRWRFKGTYKQGVKTPYKSKIMRWHHCFGLIFGLLTFTWVISGLFSVNPWKIFDHSNNKPNHNAYMGGEFKSGIFQITFEAALYGFNDIGFYPSEIEMSLIGGKGYYIGFNSQGNSMIIEAKANSIPFSQFGKPELENAAKNLFPHANLVNCEIVDAYDFYYYSRAPHTMTGHLEKRLPVYRFKFDDPYNSWVQIDSFTGTYTILDSYKRTKRILFSLLHSWDWVPLLNSRPLWDCFMIFFSIGGFIISLTGIFIGIRRLS